MVVGGFGLLLSGRLYSFWDALAEVFGLLRFLLLWLWLDCARHLWLLDDFIFDFWSGSIFNFLLNSLL